MLTGLYAKGDIRGERIDLGWTWTAPGARPALRLIRRRRAYPSTLEQGLCVVDVQDLFDGLSASEVRVERHYYLPINTQVEGGLYMAELVLYFAGPDAGQAHRVMLAYYDHLTDEYQRLEIAEVSRIERHATIAAPWEQVQTLEIFITPGGGPEMPAGRVLVSTDHEDGFTANRFEWIAEGEAAVAADFVQAREEAVRVVLDEQLDPNSGDWRRQMRVEDQGLEQGVVYYYGVWAPATGIYPFSTERDWRASAMATGRFDASERLYGLLPSVHPYFDEPNPEDRGQGQLRRFLSVFGAALDQTRGLAEGLQRRHDVREVHADALPQLARWIGWEPDMTADELILRNDILQAPEIFRTVGTVPNLRAVINRVTGWDCKIKEFVNNVFLSNAPESIRLWEIWTSRFDGSLWSEPAYQTRTDGFDGHPLVIEHAGASWLIFHSDRATHRDLWIKPRDTLLAEPYKALLYTDTERRLEPPVNEYPAALADGARLWLFWDSDRDGDWNIWGHWDEGDRPFRDAPVGTLSQLTTGSADDRHPSVVREASGRIWLFWQSNRRGPTDIWARTYEAGTGWGEPGRVSKAGFRHERPAAVIDADGRIWLFYGDDLGDRRNLNVQIYAGLGWSDPVAVSTGPQRDEAPSVALWNGQIWLFWHSLRTGHWQVQGQAWAWNAVAAAPEAVGEIFDVTRDATADKEPSVFVEGGQLHISWRSQRRGAEYRSRTFDTLDQGMRARMGTFEDRAHYSYDTQRTDQDWYARDTVGIFLTPEGEHADVVDRNRRLIEGPLRQFLPIHVRPLLFILPAVHKEYVYTYDFPEVDPQREIEEYFERETTIETTESYTGLGDAYADTVPEWIWLRSWGMDFLNHRSVDFGPFDPPQEIDTTYRTWHTTVTPGG